VERKLGWHIALWKHRMHVFPLSFPFQVMAYEALMKDLKAVRENDSPPQTTLVSQAVAGQEGTVFYVRAPQDSLAAF